MGFRADLFFLFFAAEEVCLYTFYSRSPAGALGPFAASLAGMGAFSTDGSLAMGMTVEFICSVGLV